MHIGRDGETELLVIRRESGFCEEQQAVERFGIAREETAGALERVGAVKICDAVFFDFMGNHQAARLIFVIVPDEYVALIVPEVRFFETFIIRFADGGEVVLCIERVIDGEKRGEIAAGEDLLDVPADILRLHRCERHRPAVFRRTGFKAELAVILHAERIQKSEREIVCVHVFERGRHASADNAAAAILRQCRNTAYTAELIRAAVEATEVLAAVHNTADGLIVV